jgi:hypothetical protein
MRCRDFVKKIAGLTVMAGLHRFHHLTDFCGRIVTWKALLLPDGWMTLVVVATLVMFLVPLVSIDLTKPSSGVVGNGQHMKTCVQASKSADWSTLDVHRVVVVNNQCSNVR